MGDLWRISDRHLDLDSGLDRDRRDLFDDLARRVQVDQPPARGDARTPQEARARDERVSDRAAILRVHRRGTLRGDIRRRVHPVVYQLSRERI